jgi:hypothetical protein
MKGAFMAKRMDWIPAQEEKLVDLLETSLVMRLGEYFIPMVGGCDFPNETYPAILRFPE